MNRELAQLLRKSPCARMLHSFLDALAKYCPGWPTATAAGLWKATGRRYTLQTVRHGLCELGRLGAAVRCERTRRGVAWKKKA